MRVTNAGHLLGATPPGGRPSASTQLSLCQQRKGATVTLLTRPTCLRRSTATNPAGQTKILFPGANPPPAGHGRVREPQQEEPQQREKEGNEKRRIRADHRR